MALKPDDGLRGTPTGVPCPMCMSDVEYNGTYLCSMCDWSLPDERIDPWIMLILLSGLAKTEHAAGRHESVARIHGYMGEHQGRSKYQ